MGQARSSTAAWLVATVLLTESVGPQQQQKQRPRPAAEVKAQLLTFFTHYVQWPQQAFQSKQEPFRVVVVGRGALGGALDAAIRRRPTARGRRIEVVRLGPWSDLKNRDRIGDAHMLLVDSVNQAQMRAITAQVRGGHTLVVGVDGAAMAHGGDVDFFVKERKVKFDLGDDNLRRRGFRISSTLMRYVTRQERPK